MKKFFYRYNKTILVLFLFSFFLVYSFIAISSHLHFQTFGWDLGFFDQLIWKVSRGIYPLSTLNKVNILANHFSPILFLFAPLYWIYSSPLALLVAQAFLVVFAAYPLYFLAKIKTKSTLFSGSVVFSYLFFLGTQWSILNEFHEATLAPLFIVLIFYALEANFKKRLLLIGIIGLVATKEIFSILLASIGLTIWLYFRKKKLGLFIFTFSLFFFVFLTSWFMPKISEKGVYQHAHISSEAKSPLDFMIKTITNPLFTLKSLITPIEKIKTFVVSFLSFGLIPFFAPIGILIPLFTQFLIRFLYTGPQYTAWLNVNHHAAPAAILFPIASIYAAKVISQKVPINKKRIFLILSFILITSALAQDIILKAPIHSIFKKQLYETYPWIEDNNQIIKTIADLPKNVPIATQNSLFPHLSQREKIYLLPEINDAEFIVVDLVDGPNKFAPLTYLEIKDFINNLILSGEFRLMKKQGEAMILIKNNLLP